jgi:hypothetical protein
MGMGSPFGMNPLIGLLGGLFGLGRFFWKIWFYFCFISNYFDNNIKLLILMLEDN